jgi:hypothetical protein
LGAVLLLGFFLRVFRLDAQSLWYDETYSVYIARGPFAAVGAVPEAEPLLHYYLLWGWIRATGFSEFAVRYLSLVAGVLTIPVVFRLARTTLSQSWPALAAALLVAINPFEVSYSQETRLHIFAGFFAAASVWLLLCALHRPTRGRWLAYAALAVAGLYTSYYLALVLLAVNLPVLFKRRTQRWFWANAAAVALALPGVVLGWSRLRAFSEPYPVLDQLLDPLRFAAHEPAILLFYNAPGVVEPVALALLLVAIVGVWRRNAVLIGAGLGSYVAIFAVPALAHISFYDRYELMSLPFLLVLLVAGIRALGRKAAPIMAAALVIPTGLALFDGYSNPAYQRDDNRTALAIVKQQALPDEMLIYDLRLLYTIVDYYAPNLPIPTEGLPVPKNPALPAERQFLAVTSDRQATEQELQRLSGQYAGFWLLLSGDPTQWTEDWLNAHRLPVLNRWFNGTRLVHFRPLPGPVPARLPAGERVAASFGPLRLRQIESTPLTAGKLWPVRLAWETTSQPAADYTVSLQLFDQTGQRVAQHDSQPLDGALPTSRWQPGQAYEDVAMLQLPAVLAPGAYHLSASVYDLAGGQTMPLEPLTSVTYGLQPLNLPQSPSTAGWTIESVQAGPGLLAIQGSVQTAPTTSYTWFAHVLDASGRLIAQDDHPPLTPTTVWQPGDRFSEVFRLDARGAVELGAYDATGRRATFGSSDHIDVPPA